MIYPNLNEKYYEDGDNDIKTMMQDSYNQAITTNQRFWVNADIDSRFKAGDQAIWNELYGSFPSYKKSQFNFNRIRKIVNLITGHQRKTRKSMVSVPIEASDQKTADQISKVMFWATKRDNMLYTISDAFEGAITTGMNLLNLWMDYTHDTVNGDLCLDNVSYSGYLIDPFFRKTNLSDCNYLWRREWKSKKQLIVMFPEREDDIHRMKSRENKDGKFNYMPEAFLTGGNDLLSLDEFWYLDTRTAVIIEDVKTGDTVEYFGDDETLQEFLSDDKNRVVRNTTIPTVKLVYCVNNHVFYHGPNPNGHELRPIDRYPFVPVFAYYDPDLTDYGDRIQGVCRGLRDAQYLYNRRKIIELDILESQLNSGWVYEEDALVDPSDVFMTGQGKGIAVKQGRMGSVQRIEAPGIPPSMLQVSAELGKELLEISGVNEELLGSAVDDKAGVLAMLRQGAGLTTLQKPFDQLDYSQKLLGNLMIEMIQANFRTGKIQRIINEEPSPQFREKAFQKFDCEVEDGLNTTTQRQMQFAEMLQLKEVGVPIAPEDLLEASTIQNKSTIIENMMEREQARAKTEQENMKIQLEVLKAQINDLNSKALANQGLGIERTSRVEENRSLATQRESEAVENISQAKLNKVKAVKELQEMDLNQLGKLLEIINSIQLQTEEEQVKEVDDSKDTSGSGIEALQQITS